MHLVEMRKHLLSLRRAELEAARIELRNVVSHAGAQCSNRLEACEDIVSLSLRAAELETQLRELREPTEREKRQRRESVIQLQRDA